MGYQYLEIEETENVGIIKINRPPSNALNCELVEELHSIVDDFGGRDDIRAVVFASAIKMFVAGADIKMMQENKGKNLATFMEGYTVHLQRLFNKIEEMPKPVIAAINGHAMGGGCELTLACDFRFMARGKGKIGLPEVKLGLLPGGGGTQRLSRLLGKAKAMEMIVNGLSLSAEEALNVGLVHRIFDLDELFKGTIQYARELATGATMAIGMIKRCINKGLDTNLKTGLALEIESQDNLFKSEDAEEGITAFLGKRPPRFKGK